MQVTGELRNDAAQNAVGDAIEHGVTKVIVSFGELAGLRTGRCYSLSLDGLRYSRNMRWTVLSSGQTYRRWL